LARFLGLEKTQLALGTAELLLRGDFSLGLGATVAAKMYDRHAPLIQHAAYQQPAMTIGGVLFAAEDRHPTVRRQSQQLFNAPTEVGRPSHFAVKHSAIVVIKAFVLDASAQQVAEEYVLNRTLRCGSAKRFAVELRSVARIRTRSYVGHRLDAVPTQ
jgi:hypothetical protein